MSIETPVVKLSNQALLEETVRLMKEARTVTARLIAILAQVAERQAYLEAGYSSLFAYCTDGLKLSDDEAYARMTAARATLDFPLVLEYLEDGSLMMTNLCLLRPYLTEANHSAVLAAARHKTKREVQQQIGQLVSHVPLFPLRFDVPVETLNKWDRARELLAHVIPDGNGAEVFDRALTALIEQLEKKKFGLTNQPRDRMPEPSSGRYLPAAVRRKVFKRDGGRCTFIGKDGLRCASMWGLQFHHIDPRAVGGLNSVKNITLRCGPHNRYEAEVYYGRSMDSMIPDRKAPPLPAAPDGTASPTRSGPS